MNQNKRTAKLLIISFIFLIWFFSSIGLSIYNVKAGNTWIFLITLGQFFIVMGSFAIIAMVSEKQNGWWLGALFVFVGSGCVTFGLMNRFGSDDIYSKMVNVIPLVLGVTMTIVSLVMLIHDATSRKKLRDICTYEITAKCIGHRVRGAGHRVAICPIYEAVFNGDRLILNKNIYAKGLGNPEKEETRQLRICLDDIKKNDPNSSTTEDIQISRYIDEKTDKAVAAFTNIMLSSFFAAGIILSIAAYLFIPIF